MRNIMLIGKMGSGKTTIARALKKDFDYEILSFADPVKAVVYGLAEGQSPEPLIYRNITKYTQLSSEQLQTLINMCHVTKEIKSEPPKFRERLQFFGTDCGRNVIDKDLWIKCLLARIEDLELDDSVVVDDVRFINEYYALLKKDFLPVVVSVAPDTQKERLEALYGKQTNEVINHESETQIELMRGKALLEDGGISLNGNLSESIIKSMLVSITRGG